MLTAHVVQYRYLHRPFGAYFNHEEQLSILLNANLGVSLIN